MVLRTVSTHSTKDSFNRSGLSSLACTSLGALTGGFHPTIGPIWLMPGALENDSLEAPSSRAWLVEGIGATLHLPFTQPPTSRPRLLAPGCEGLPLARPESNEIGFSESLVVGDARFEELACTSAILASGCDDGKAMEKARGSGVSSVAEGLGRRQSLGFRF